MPILRRLRETLDAAGVRYEILHHDTAYTAEETAAAQHVPGHAMAKVVICMAGEPPRESPLMAVVPATARVHLATLARAAAVRHLRLASEAESAALFPGCEPGAMPPFGALYGMPVWVDERLAREEHLVFNAGTHQLAVRLGWSDYARLESPEVADFAVRHEAG